jgi:hypothetical protein
MFAGSSGPSIPENLRKNRAPVVSPRVTTLQSSIKERIATLQSRRGQYIFLFATEAAADLSNRLPESVFIFDQRES